MVVLMIPLLAPAQSEQSPFPEALAKQLAARASNYTEVTLDRNMLQFASRFMDKEEDAEGKRIIAKLNGVYVRTYEFEKEGEYTPADLENIRRQFQGPEWSSLVRSRSKNASDDTDVYMKMVNGEVQGMFVLNAESRELDFVYISGPIRPEDLKDISGNFGIPAMGGKAMTGAGQKTKDKTKDQTRDKTKDKAQKEGQP
jgi:hypothetical protein